MVGSVPLSVKLDGSEGVSRRESTGRCFLTNLFLELQSNDKYASRVIRTQYSVYLYHESMEYKLAKYE